MKNFLKKYNATKLETTKDESQLSLDAYKQRILSCWMKIWFISKTILGAFRTERTN